MPEGGSDSGAAPWLDRTTGPTRCDVARRDLGEHIATIGFWATTRGNGTPGVLPSRGSLLVGTARRGIARRPGVSKRSIAHTRHYPHDFADLRPRSGLAYFGDPRFSGG